VRLDGKHGPASGVPVDARVIVKGLVRGAFQPFGKAVTPMGDMAWLRIGPDAHAIDVVVNDRRTQGFSPECFTCASIDLAKTRAVIVKSTQHFHAGFLPIAPLPQCDPERPIDRPESRVSKAEERTYDDCPESPDTTHQYRCTSG